VQGAWRSDPDTCYPSYRGDNTAITHACAGQGRVVAQGDKKDVLTGEVLSRTFDLSIEVKERYGRLWPVVMKP